jgi:hypothetical protein
MEKNLNWLSVSCHDDNFTDSSVESFRRCIDYRRESYRQLILQVSEKAKEVDYMGICDQVAWRTFVSSFFDLLVVRGLLDQVHKRVCQLHGIQNMFILCSLVCHILALTRERGTCLGHAHTWASARGYALGFTASLIVF